MVENTSNAGPFRFRLGQLPVGTPVVFNTQEADGGPRNKPGGLTKFYGRRGGFDFVIVTNNSDEIISVETNGGAGQDVPPATSTVVSGVGPDGTPTPSSTAYTFVEVTNTGIVGGVAVAADEVSVAFGNGPRPEEASGGRAGGFAFDVADLIPGVVRNG